MLHMPEKIGLVVPCFNERLRLHLEGDAWRDPNLHGVFVDDGSTDGSADWIRQMLVPPHELLCLPRHGGKAEAVRRGMLHLQASPFVGEFQWVGFWDADMATPLSELYDMIQYTRHFDSEADGIIGSRVYRLGSRIERSFTRHIAGRCFATSLGWMFPELPVYDSQCGAKLFRPRLLERGFKEPFVARWIFDVEILLRLREARVIEYPLRRWRDVPGSKINIFSALGGVAMDLLKLKRRYHYTQTLSKGP